MNFESIKSILFIDPVVKFTVKWAGALIAEVCLSIFVNKYFFEGFLRWIVLFTTFYLIKWFNTAINQSINQLIFHYFNFRVPVTSHLLRCQKLIHILLIQTWFLMRWPNGRATKSQKQMSLGCQIMTLSPYLQGWKW